MSAEYHTARGPGDMPAWRSWPVYWSAIWVGALTALVVGLILGLTATSVGAHEAGRLANFHKVSVIALCFAVGGAFGANAAGGWVAAKIAGILRGETAMLHGAIVWLVAVPILLGFAAIGGGSLFGGWYGGLAGAPAWASSAGATTDPAVLRNEALAALTAILVGLVGAVLGAWAGSGQAMTFGHRDEGTDYEHERVDVTVREVRTPA